MATIGDFTRYWRIRHPSLYLNKSDEEIFDLVKERRPDLKIPSFHDAKQHELTLRQQKIKRESLLDSETSPKYIDNWFSTGDFIPDKFQKQGFAGISPEFFQESFNNSMAGGFYKTIHGVDKYEVEDYFKDKEE